MCRRHKRSCLHLLIALTVSPPVLFPPFLKFPFFSHQPVFFQCQVIQGFMRSLAVVFRQPALCNFPNFIQRSEQIKIQGFCPICPVRTFDKGILCRLTRFDKVRYDPMLFGPLCPCKRHQSVDIHGLPLSCRALASFAAPGYSD